MYIKVFFFKQKTAYEMRISDWSSDVCSSDLQLLGDQHWAVQASGSSVSTMIFEITANAPNLRFGVYDASSAATKVELFAGSRSDERRVGQECVSPCRSRWSP